MPNKEKVYDAIVVGAGPAGSTAARELAKLGCDVLLIDKMKFPRDKICGGLVPVKVLKELEFNIPNCYIKNNIYDITIYDRLMNKSTYRSNDLMGITVLRREFDFHLLNRAIAQGVTFFEETSFEKLSREHSLIKTFTNKGIYWCKVLIGCDGVFSKVKRQVFEANRMDFYKMGITLTARFIKTDQWRDTEFNLFQLPILYTMGWAIPSQDEVIIGVGGPWINRKKILKGFDGFLETLHLSKNNEDNHMKGAFLPAGGFARKIHSNGILLSGDAAGFVDPLTGEGLYYAIRSAKIAAELIYKEDIASYEKRCKEEFQSVLRASLLKNLLGFNKLFSKTEPLRSRLCETLSKTMLEQKKNLN